MASFTEVLRGLCMLITVLVFAPVYLLYYCYVVFDSGQIQLPNAPGTVTVSREADTQIMHIKGEDWPSIAYG